ncbi:unnamed protein product [Diabrotica balteata]|uniref:MSP domain-containing protein n=1 Tax=Diabrotica balteata TaxID=107213 RepID=A0A9N9X741_DIABA|nr:unnamed protein product [Diabrotica balteata]
MFKNNKKIAPGMSVIATITFRPKIYKTVTDTIRFKNNTGEIVEVQIIASRDVPKLITCIFKSSNTNLLASNNLKPGFKEKRREALNSTIDCGSCLVSQYVLVSMILENRGITGKFFFITEDDWFFQNINDVSSCMELFKGDFWIYPTFFEVCNQEIVEVNIIFQPTKPGLHAETLYLMCDNNTFQEIELVGDAVEFSESLIEINVPPEVTEISSKQNYTVFFGLTFIETIKSFNVMVKNKSSACLSCEWRFKNKDSKNLINLPEEWIIQKKFYPILKPYSTTEFEFDVHIIPEKIGYHSIFFCFYITNVPYISLKENEDFVVIERTDICGKTLSKAVDVLISQIEVCVLIQLDGDETRCLCDEAEQSPQRKQKMYFSYPILNFGILPSGIDVQKEFYVINSSDQNLSWQIWEIKYDIDCQPYMQINRESENLSEAYGTCNACESYKLLYKISNQGVQSYVSFLVLISVTEQNIAVVEDICVIIYEVINFKIKITSKYLSLPILYSAEIIYSGIPTDLELFVENLSPITGYFQFLSPIGDDAAKMIIELTPRSSIIKPYQTITIKVQLTCMETGFFQDTYIPCFIGLGQEPVIVKVICAVDGPRVIYHLPRDNKNFKNIVWPPIFYYNYDLAVGPRDERLIHEEYNNSAYQSDKVRKELNQDVIKLNFTTDEHEIKVPLECRNNLKSTEGEEDCQNKSSTSIFSGIADQNLEYLLRQGSDESLFLHEDVIEIRNIQTFTATRISIYIENISPISVIYNIQSRNFYYHKNVDHTAVRQKQKNIVDLCKDTPHGIVVQPDIQEDQIEGYCALRIDFWIYANTFGIYTEEIIVEVSEIPDYHFSMIIEVVGCPVQIPLALNCITECPTIRFGSVAFHSENINRKIKIMNVSAIPVQIIWYPFNNKLNEKYINEEQPFTILFHMFGDNCSEKIAEIVVLDKYFGEYCGGFCDVEQRETYINPHSEAFINIRIKPTYFKEESEDINIVNYLLGLINIDSQYTKCVNYYYRKTDPNVHQVQIQVQTRLEAPTLQLDFSEQTKNSLHVYANDILLKNQYDHHKYVVLRNTSGVEFEVDMYVDSPFYFKKSKQERFDRITMELTGGSAREVHMYCQFTPNDILDLSPLIYSTEKENSNPRNQKRILDEEKALTKDDENKIISITKTLTIRYRQHVKKFPMEISIHYPNISVTPFFVDYSNVLLNQANKNMITVFNHTGCVVKFEIRKSRNANSFVITPHYGEIPASTGKLKQFVNIFIYFCATECKKYSESLRIVTNIPDYFIEVPLKGVGSINEKFCINYKI